MQASNVFSLQLCINVHTLGISGFHTLLSKDNNVQCHLASKDQQKIEKKIRYSSALPGQWVYKLDDNPLSALQSTVVEGTSHAL